MENQTINCPNCGQKIEVEDTELEKFRDRAEQLRALLAEAAHEYKGPLHNVLSLSTAMSKTSNRRSLKQFGAQMKSEVYRAKRVIDNYLLRGLPDTGGLKYNFKKHNLGVLIEDCTARFKSLALKKNQRIKVEDSARKLPDIVADSDRIDQVISNVIDNAIKYGFSKTEIVLGGKETQDSVEIFVSNLGLGIPKEDRDTIFMGYQRTMDDKQVFRPGTGLGLMIAKKIISEHGGNISVESSLFRESRESYSFSVRFITKFVIKLPKVQDTGNV